MKRCLLLLVSSVGISAIGGVGVSVVPQMPWGKCVDVWVTLSDVEAETEYRVKLTASYAGCPVGGLVAQSLLTDPVVKGAGRHRLVWDLAQDAPGLIADDFVVTAEVLPFTATDDVFRVIDLSAGPEAASYPSRYSFAAPDLADDTCRTTELWLKRVPAGMFTMGSGTGSAKTIAAHSVKLTKAFYMAIFPTTQKQWERVMGDWPSYFTNEAYRAARPVEQVSWSRIRGHQGWYDDTSAPDKNTTFVGRLRAKSGIAGVELPSEAQWEYVCRAGTTGEYYFNGMAVQVRNYARTANWDGTSTDDRNQDLTKGTAKVGSYPANPWGFYDFYGNVCQFVPDGAKQNSWKGLTFGTDLTEDPRWAFADDESVVFSGIRRGTSWSEVPGTVSSSCRRWTQFLNSDGSAHSGDSAYGFRICVNAE